MHKVAVYGTLKKGLGNHRLLKESKYLGKDTLHGFVMYSLGHFPAVIPRDFYGIEVEVYEADKPTLEKLDILEGYGGEGRMYNMYNRETTKTKYGEAFIYIWNTGMYDPLTNRAIVEDGNWKGPPLEERMRYWYE